MINTNNGGFTWVMFRITIVDLLQLYSNCLTVNRWTVLLAGMLG